MCWLGRRFEDLMPKKAIEPLAGLFHRLSFRPACEQAEPLELLRVQRFEIGMNWNSE